MKRDELQAGCIYFLQRPMYGWVKGTAVHLRWDDGTCSPEFSRVILERKQDVGMYMYLKDLERTPPIDPRPSESFKIDGKEVSKETFKAVLKAYFR